MPLEEKIRKLPPGLVFEVEDFVDFLLKKHQVRAQDPLPTLSLSWAGVLKKLGGELTSVELQHKALGEWWPR